MIHFKEDTHEYSLLHAETGTIVVLGQSMSSLSKPFFKVFDTNKNALSVYRKRKRDASSPYYWLIQSQPDPDDEKSVTRAITDAWTNLGQRAASDGTRAHLNMEHYLNGQSPCVEYTHPKDDRDRRIKKLTDAGRKWVDETAFGKYKWKAFRTEHSIYIDMSRATKRTDGDMVANHAKFIAGQLDALFDDPSTGEYHLVDWKFCKKDKLDERSGEYMGTVPYGEPPLQMLTDNSLGHYTVQQSMYAFVLKRRYGISVKTARLIHIPADMADPVAREIELNLLPDDVILDMIKRYLLGM